MEKVSQEALKLTPVKAFEGKKVPGTDTFETIVVTRIGLPSAIRTSAERRSLLLLVRSLRFARLPARGLPKASQPAGADCGFFAAPLLRVNSHRCATKKPTRR